MKKRIAFLLAIILFFTCMHWSATPAAAAPEEKSPADDCKILDYVHEDVFEKADHLGRMPEEETLSNYVFLNKDGTRTAYYLDEAVKFVDNDGKIKEKDITLQSVLGGYATTQNDVTVTLPITMSSGVNLSYNNHQISLIPEGGTSSAPRIVNNSAEYVDFYGADTVLKYTPTLSGMKEDIILESYTGQNTFTFILNTNGLAVYHTKEDRYYLAPGKGTDPVYWLGALEIYDSALNMGTGTMTVEPMMAGQKYKITITVDASWLTSAKTVYPVTVDPSITISDNTNGAGAIVDAPIFENHPNTNYGSYIYNRAGYAGSSYGRGRTVVDLIGMRSDPIYMASSADDIVSAKFYVAGAGGAYSTGVTLHPITDVSSAAYMLENQIRWNSIVAYSAYSSNATVKDGLYASFDITDLVQSWKNGAWSGGQYGVILIGTNEASIDKALYSCEHSTTNKRPYVTVTITPVDYTFVAVPEQVGNDNYMVQYNAFADSLAVMGLTDYRIDTSVNPSEFVAYIATSDVFIFRGHGAATYIQLTGGNLNITMLSAYPSTYLSECSLVLYGACLTGSGGEGADNMVNATHACGAQTVIGFEKKIFDAEFTIWVDAFF